MDYFQPKMPFEELPYNFKKRLIRLAPIPDVTTLRETCPEIKYLCRHRPYQHDYLFITDNRQIFCRARPYERLFNILKLFVTSWFIRLYDGPGSFHPVWLTTLFYNKEKEIPNSTIYVGDTLTLYLESTEAYDVVIPLIVGPYTRLSLRGSAIRWDQIKRLAHPKVRHIQILAKIEIEPADYDDFAEFLYQRMRGFRSTFAFSNQPNYPIEFILKLRSAVKRRLFYIHYELEWTCVFHVWFYLSFFIVCTAPVILILLYLRIRLLTPPEYEYLFILDPLLPFMPIVAGLHLFFAVAITQMPSL